MPQKLYEFGVVATRPIAVNELGMASGDAELELRRFGPPLFVATAGRVATLLIEADRQIAGRRDVATGRVEVADLSHPQVDDPLDDLGELVDKMGGQVLAIPAEQMPGRTGLAATYQY